METSNSGQRKQGNSLPQIPCVHAVEIPSHLSAGLDCAGGVAVIKTIKPSWVGIQVIKNDTNERGGKMDKTELYVKMCDCPEIQGDKVAMRDTDYFVYATSKKGTFYIWLPRQDQIQEMMNEPQNALYLLKRLNDWKLDYNHGWMLNASMEQLWLAFLFKEKYNKVWDSKRQCWIKDISK